MAKEITSEDVQNYGPEALRKAMESYSKKKEARLADPNYNSEYSRAEREGRVYKPKK